MLARKGIFAKPSMTQTVRITVRHSRKALCSNAFCVYYTTKRRAMRGAFLSPKRHCPFQSGSMFSDTRLKSPISSTGGGVQSPGGAPCKGKPLALCALEVTSSLPLEGKVAQRSCDG